MTSPAAASTALGAVGWAGVGRMGSAMAGRLLDAGVGVVLWNRSPEKAEALADRGATVASTLSSVAANDVVFTMIMDDVAAGDVILGPEGLLAAPHPPDVLIECSTLSVDVAEQIELAASEVGTDVVHAPISGNPAHVRAGEASIIASGSRDGYERAEPYLQAVTPRVVFAGPGIGARVAKICHNVIVGALAESLAEVSILGEACGVPRAALLSFLDGSVLGSVWLREKARAMAELDFAPTFTPQGLRKDLGLARDLAWQRGVAAPVLTATADQLTRLVGSGIGTGRDYAALLELVARDSDHLLAADTWGATAGPAPATLESIEGDLR